MQRVGIRTWNPLRNCGDAVAAWLLRDVLGLAAVAVPPGQEHVLPIGSILWLATAASHAWGVGLHRPDAAMPPLAPGRIAALRGRRTVAALRAGGLRVPEVPLGDPGVLVARLPQVRAWQEEVRRDGFRHRAALVPHWSMTGHPAFRGFPGLGDDVTLVDMRTDGLEPLRRIIGAEVVLSQSLHGLVFAEALGRPSLWLGDPADVAGRFKFEDWYGEVDNPPRAPWPLDRLGRDDLARAEPRAPRVDAAALVAAFPRAARLPPRPGAVGFEAARRASPVTTVVEGLLGPEPRPLAALPPGAAGRLSHGLGRALDALYAGWDERPFTLLHRPGWRPPPGLAVQLRAYLEQRPVELVSVLDPAHRARLPGPPMPAGEWAGWAVAPGLAVLGDALMLRPGGDGRLDARIDAIFVPPVAGPIGGPPPAPG
ncbi:polysaccharide pyruvyl transferase family protein [Roseomonas sp. OT10]|uniref:polysaccharide pyruvyl transferase family protein n=1 Tax=Roseomonas cutis TaxID=2897332 RepID=UPI001E3C9594|nr:polysaccharide pyruvyl transferase family protein [Roseomonas sp. OT10]UFN48806.1 polysaccharide pyruvyl transferase family protein [Roseomonas sp. OT10]